MKEMRASRKGEDLVYLRCGHRWIQPEEEPPGVCSLSSTLLWLDRGTTIVQESWQRSLRDQPSRSNTRKE